MKPSNAIYVKEKKVSQIELFYDLIYVYAISRLTLLVEEPEGGVIPLSGFSSYLIVCFVILQAWLYLTNYVNRYGRWRWYEYVLIVANMIGAVYTANTILPDWNGMSGAFNLAMLVMLLCVWALYFIQICLKEQDTGAAKNSLVILMVVCLLYLSAFLASALQAHAAVMWMDIAAVLVGAFLPFFIRGDFDISIISFPHLAERFELLTIVTFGESVVGMAGYFDVQTFTMRPILVFAVVFIMFGCYMIQLHVLCDHYRSARALRLMFTHYFIVISVNLMTIAFHFLQNPEADRIFTTLLMTAALLIFYLSIFADSAYYFEGLHFKGRDAAISAASLAAGTAVMLGGRDNIYLFLAGALVAVCGNLGMLMRKYKERNTGKRGGGALCRKDQKN